MSGAVSRAGEGVRPAADSYRPDGYGMSQALHRARRPFHVRNAIVGATVAVFVVGVYTYSIRAVKQEDFSDIDILAPAVEERAAIKSIEDEQKEKNQLAVLRAGTLSPLGSNATQRASPAANTLVNEVLQPGTSNTPDSAAPATYEHAAPASLPRGFVSKIIPQALHPTDGTVVWGAPNVDKVGLIGDRTSVSGEKGEHDAIKCVCDDGICE